MKEYLKACVGYFVYFCISFIRFKFGNKKQQKKIDMKVIKQTDYKVNQWAGGITRELMIYPEGSSLGERNFDFRISSAIIDLTESDFSDFSGYKRYILPIEGNVTLFRADEKIILSPDVPFLFDGSEAIHSENSKGAIDFNVIFREGYPLEVEVVNDVERKQTRAILFALEDIEVNNSVIVRHDAVLMNEDYSIKGKAIEVRF
ncbi:hypothetical protein DXC89_02930 [Prevotella disiens]|uniref:HutD family protein n=2 Tax=Prevotella disiens TaxID=28130 RepID=A0A3E4QLK8_9BACT|nr:hypothetical protein DXC89_02930 [Prevotella disiens]